MDVYVLVRKKDRCWTYTSSTEGEWPLSKEALVSRALRNEFKISTYFHQDRSHTIHKTAADFSLRKNTRKPYVTTEEPAVEEVGEGAEEMPHIPDPPRLESWRATSDPVLCGEPSLFQL